MQEIVSYIPVLANFLAFVDKGYLPKWFSMG